MLSLISQTFDPILKFLFKIFFIPKIFCSNSVKRSKEEEEKKMRFDP
jgi:hypothetical protein